MSGERALRRAMMAALRGDAALMALVNMVEDSGRVRASPPAITIGGFAASEWGARGLRGLNIRAPLTLVDRADTPDRLAEAAVRVEAAMDDLPEQAGLWRIGTVRLDRSRTLRSADGQWSVLIDYLVRLSRLL